MTESEKDFIVRMVGVVMREAARMTGAEPPGGPEPCGVFVHPSDREYVNGRAS